MKKLFFLIIMFFGYIFASNAQVYTMRTDFIGPDTTYRWLIGYPVIQKVVLKAVKDRTYELNFNRITYTTDTFMLPKNDSTKNYGTIDRIAHFTNNGKLVVSPISELHPDYNNLTNKPTLFDGDYNSLSNKPTLFSGAYSDLTGKPSLFSGDYTDLSNKPTLFSGSYTDLTNKPTLFSGSYLDLTNKPSIPSTTTDLPEGSNLYWTRGRFNTQLSTKTTSDLTEGSNLYWTGTRFNTAFSGKSTSDLTEGSNQYFTTARARSSVSATGNYISYNSGTGVITSTIPTIPNDYYNTVAIAGGAGQAVFYLTSDKTSSGTALYTTIDAVIPIVNDATQNYTYGWSYNSTTKALTVTTKTNLTAVITLLTVVLGPTNAPNGTNVQLVVKGH